MSMPLDTSLADQLDRLLGLFTGFVGYRNLCPEVYGISVATTSRFARSPLVCV